MGPVDATGRSVGMQLPDGTSRVVRAGVVLVADGLAGTALRHLPELAGKVSTGSRVGTSAIVADAPAGYGGDEVRLACARSGYVGVVRLEDGRLNIAAALDREAMRAGPGRSVAGILRQNGLPVVPGLEDRDWRGTPALTRRRAVVAGERFFVLGDAAGYVEPFTGEGIAWAIEAAVVSSEWFCRAAEGWDRGLSRTWMRRHHALVRSRRWGCRVVAAILRRPFLTRALIAASGRTPGLARPFVHHLTQPSPTRGRGGT
jgi:flavin-dependent dehydrogenase